MYRCDILYLPLFGEPCAEVLNIDSSQFNLYSLTTLKAHMQHGKKVQYVSESDESNKSYEENLSNPKINNEIAI